MRSKICIEIRYNYEATEIVRIAVYDTKVVTSTLLQVPIMYNVTLFIVQCGKVCSPVCRAVYRTER